MHFFQDGMPVSFVWIDGGSQGYGTRGCALAAYMDMVEKMEISLEAGHMANIAYIKVTKRDRSIIMIPAHGVDEIGFPEGAHVESYESEQLKKNQKVLEHLQAGFAVTQQDAIRLWNCYRLAARIKDLRDDGHDITESKGKGDRHSTYRLRHGHGTTTLFALPTKGRPE